MRRMSRALFVFLVTLVLWSMAAVDTAALEIWRNQTRYEIDVPLPNGASFKKAGVDRKASIRGVDINLRLIQDTYPNCGKLVAERESAGWERNYSSLPGNRKVSARECSTQIYGPTRITIKSHYIWLDMCQCFAAIHFAYPDGLDDTFEEISPPILAALRNPTRAPRKGKPLTGYELDPDWLEAFAIFRKRGFPAALVYNILGDTAHIALGARGLGDRYAEELARLYGTSAKEVKDGDAASASWFFDLETGFAIHSASPQQIASKLSSCYRKRDYWTACKLNYHQEKGCRMTASWKKVCGAYMKPGMSTMIGDLCFWEPRGDLPMLGGGDTREKTVALPSGKKAKAPSRKKVAARSEVPYCEDDGYAGWRPYLRELRDRGDGVPAGLKL
ncbi:hypothetical protein [Hoeflea sp. BAL378]|uniref:hypothetical protein n=1 Tax=Hoeflea sp. BAL378 TaxID=1547437 RepID=UPI001269923A|nr:hypothetical protein [Hoeflea sp. BAL378]